LIGFELLDKGVPRKDYDIADESGNTIGIVTSGTMGPSVKKGIGMGYVAIDHTKPGHIIYIKVRKRLLKAKVVTLPFYKNE
jgi:aminomethyltransferase